MNNQEWEALEGDIRECRGCALCGSRTKVVPGKGSREAKILFVGEAPGEDEDRHGLPFVGRAGKLLDKLFFAVDLTLEDIYVANILKCRPPANRDPSEAESEACMPFLRRQTKLLEPRLIVCLGRIAAMRLISPGFKITMEHGIWFERGEYLMCAVYHPAALLRDPSKKGETLEDFKNIRKKAEELGILGTAEEK